MTELSCSAASPSLAPSPEINGSMNEHQAEAVFDTIASHANLLRELLANLRRQPQRHGNPAALFADLAMAEVLTTQIGALADQMVDGRVVGSLASWVAGPDLSYSDGNI